MALPNSNLLDYPLTSETERLQIRPVVKEDAVHWINFFNDPVAIKYFPTFKVEEAETNLQAWMDKVLNRYRDGQFGLHSLIERATGDYVGQCGLLVQEVDGIHELEIGYSLLRKYWGKGYATEAATFMKDWAFERKISEYIISLIHVDNLPSKKVAERNGMTVWKECIWRELPVAVYRTMQP